MLKGYCFGSVLLAAWLLVVGAGGAVAATFDGVWPQASASKLPRWRGFNLPDRMNSQAPAGTRHNRPFREETFQLIREFGFNFARIPTDYRHWIVDNDWARIDETAAVLQDLDRVVAWGETYGIHIMVVFVFAPGYFVAEPDAKPSLWYDVEAQEACARHWAMLARRYRGVASDRLSFNLWNEPPALDPDVHRAVVAHVVEAIRKEDPERLIVADGRDIAKTPSVELLSLGVAQALHCYAPARLTHYRASWAKGSDQWPLPQWPRPQTNGWLRGPGHPDHGGEALVLVGPFPADARLSIQVGDVFAGALLVAEADGTEIWRRDFAAGPPGEGEWRSSILLERWGGYQATYDQTYDVVLPTEATRIRLFLDKGNWLQVTRLGLRRPGAAEAAIDVDSEWAAAPGTLAYTPTAAGGGWRADTMEDRDWLRAQFVPAWQPLERQGVGVFVGELGVFNLTPHSVTLSWLEDALAVWHDAGWGWALWNFDGPFGILDSERADVNYEHYRGHLLDRKMLDILQRY